MTSLLDSAAMAVAIKISTFVRASDRLVNLLNDTPRDEAAIEQAMNVYDVARRELTGEDVSSA